MLLPNSGPRHNESWVQFLFNEWLCHSQKLPGSRGRVGKHCQGVVGSLGPWVPVGPGPGKDNDRGRAITDFLVLRSAQPRSTLREQRALKQR